MVQKEKLWHTKRVRNHTNLNIRRFDPAHVRHSENPPPNKSLTEAKALKVIEKKSFGIPRALTGDGIKSNMTPEQAQEYIAKNWPNREAANILGNIDIVETFGHQSTMVHFSQKNDIFYIDNFKREGPALARKQDVSWITNPFWQDDLNIIELTLSKSEEAATQKKYQTTYNENGMDKVYYQEVESLLKSIGLIKEHNAFNLSDNPNKISIISLPKENLVIVLAKIGQRASTRPGASYQLPIIFQTKEPQQLVDFLVKNKANGLNAIFSLINSQDLSPNIPPNFYRHEIFYALENQDQNPFVVKAELKEFNILKADNIATLGKVKRLRPIKD